MSNEETSNDSVLIQMLSAHAGGEGDAFLLKADEKSYKVQLVSKDDGGFAAFFKTREVAEKIVDTMIEHGGSDSRVDAVRRVQDILEGEEI